MAQVIIWTRPDGGVDIMRPPIVPADVPADAIDVATVEESTLPTDREFREIWKQSAGSITISFSKGQVLARSIMTRLVRREMTFLDDRRVQAEIEDDTTLVSQIDARKTSLQTTIIPQIRDGIAAATSLADLKTVRQVYLNGRP